MAFGRAGGNQQGWAAELEVAAVKVRVFLFAPESQRILAVVRIGLAVFLFYDFLSLQPYLVEFFSSAGHPMLVDPDGWLRVPVLSPSRTAMLFGLLQFSLLATAVGWHTRLSLLAATLLIAWFGLLDGLMTITKYRVLAIHIFFLLACSQCGTVWSVDWLLSRDRMRLNRLGSAWPRRLIQLLICAMYLGGVCTKWHLGDFISGDQIVFSLLDSGMARGPHSMELALHPMWAVRASVATMVFEFSFPLLIWVRRARPFMLAAAVAFHLGIACVMSLNVFSYVVIVAVLAFVDDRDLASFRRKTGVVGAACRRWMGRWFPPAAVESISLIAPDERTPSSLIASWRTPVSLAAYVAFAIGAAGISFAWDYHHDRYAVYHTQPAESLPEVPVETIETVLSNQPAPLEDYFHRMEIGSRPGGRHVFGETQRFRTGTTLFVNVRLLVPHPTFLAELHLVGPDDETYARQRMQVPELMSHISAKFPLTNDLPAGEFQLHWLANGEDIYQRPFEVEPGDNRSKEIPEDRPSFEKR
jgi:Vitamin K-dependent gamma-carboxylase